MGQYSTFRGDLARRVNEEINLRCFCNVSFSEKDRNSGFRLTDVGIKIKSN